MRTLTIIFGFILFGSHPAQTAANFSVNDCSGSSHELFQDLDAGKVAVIIWVMPCASCITDALETQSEVQNALSSNPGKVKFYVVDDYGNTTCSTLSGWCAANSITDAVLISNKSVSMSSYGEPGMPKVVIAGGTDHKVYYNENAPVLNVNAVKDAIAAALAAPTGITNNSADNFSAIIAPNPASNSVKIVLNSAVKSNISVEIINQLGQVIKSTRHVVETNGRNELNLETTELSTGTYFVEINDGNFKLRERLVIAR